MGITALGLVAGVCIILAMLERNILRIKWLLLIGCALFLAYGILLQLIPVIFLNGAGLVIGAREIIVLHKKGKV